MMVAYVTTVTEDGRGREVAAYDQDHLVGVGRVATVPTDQTIADIQVHPDYLLRNIADNIRKLLMADPRMKASHIRFVEREAASVS